MRAISFRLLAGLVTAASMLFAAACGSDGDASTSIKTGTDGGDGGAATATSDAGQGDGGSCSLSLGASTGCPETATAENAYEAMATSCSLSTAELQPSDAGYTVTDAAKPKLCASCACRAAVYGYRTVYAQCTTEDQDNAMLSANLFAVASTCP